MNKTAGFWVASFGVVITLMFGLLLWTPHVHYNRMATMSRELPGEIAEAIRAQQLVDSMPPGEPRSQLILDHYLPVTKRTSKRLLEYKEGMQKYKYHQSENLPMGKSPDETLPTTDALIPSDCPPALLRRLLTAE